MWKSLWTSSPQVGMGKLCELVAVGPGGSRVRAAKSPDGVTVAARLQTFQLFPSLATSFTFLP